MMRGSAVEATALVVTGSQLGKLLGLSERRVRELRDDGVIPDDGAGRYLLAAAVPAYCAHIRPASGREAAGGSDIAVTVDTARVRLMTAQAEAREMLNSQMRGETVLAEDMEAVVGAVCDAVRAKMLAVPTKASPLLLGLTSLPEVRDKLTGLIHAACDELADAVAICASVLDRARRRAGRGSGGESADEALSAAATADRKPVG